MRPPPRNPAGIVSLTVGRSDSAALQDFLVRRLSISRRAAKTLVDSRSVWVNRNCVWIARYAIKTGDVVEVPAAAVNGLKVRKFESSKVRGGQPSSIQASPRRHVRILWQNDDYLVCDKPAGMLSCDDAGSVEELLREQESLPSLAAVHRLDRDTTGCLLFAKNAAALDAAIECFKAHKVTKIYHAIVLGRFPYQHQTIDAPIGGEKAVSHLTRETASADASLLRISIETGRTNQIRRHLASIRFPVVGDRVFGFKSARDPRLMGVPRQMLHASTLELPDPSSPRSSIHAHSPMPADFRSTLRAFGMGRRAPGRQTPKGKGRR